MEDSNNPSQEQNILNNAKSQNVEPSSPQNIKQAPTSTTPPTSNLQQGQPMNQLHPNVVWSFFLKNLFVFLFFVFFFISSLGALVTTLSLSLNPLVFVFIGFLFWIILSFISAKLSYKYWKYQLVETSLRIEKGIIWKKYISIPYGRIQNVDIYRGVITRILGLSDIHIQTAGYSAPKHSLFGAEGRLPGLGVQVAEQLRDQLINKTRGNQQGL